MDFLDAVSSLLGKRRAESTGIQQPTNVHLVTMEAVEASSDGTVLVDPGGDVISPDGSQYVEIQTVGSVQEGDEVAVALVGEPGGAMDVMAIGTVGEGDHQNERIGAIEADYVKATELEADVADIGFLKADSATITDLQADAAKVHSLTAEQLSAATGYVGELQAGSVSAQDIVSGKATVGQLAADHVSVSDLDAATARIGELEADHVTVNDFTAATGRIGTLESDHVTVADFQAEQANIDALQANTADIDTIRANSAKVQNLTAAQLEADHATIGSMDANYAQVNLANVDNAWIENGTVKDGAITNAMINSVSANKLTAGTIDASNINVTNLNADNLTTGTINGQRIGEGSLSLSKLEDDVYTETEVDAKLATMQAEIDGAIETWTGTAVPTLNNEPASGWTTADERDRHVGDVYFVVNSQSQQNGYNYRFTKSGSTYSWQLIKDNDVTAALQRLTDAEGRIGTIEQFDSDISSWKTDTDEELSSIKSEATTLAGRVTTAEGQIATKVEQSTFNELSQTVSGNSASITSLTTTTTELRNDLDGIDVGARNLLRHTDDPKVNSEYYFTRSTAENDGAIRLTPTTSYALAASRSRYLDFSEFGQDKYTLSFDARLADVETEYTNVDLRAYIGYSDADTWSGGFGSNVHHHYCSKPVPDDDLTTEWKRLSYTYDSIADRTGGSLVPTAGCSLRVEFYSAGSSVPTEVRRVKLERGTMATDWSPAPEDSERKPNILRGTNQNIELIQFERTDEAAWSDGTWAVSSGTTTNGNAEVVELTDGPEGQLYAFHAWSVNSNNKDVAQRGIDIFTADTQYQVSFYARLTPGVEQESAQAEFRLYGYSTADATSASAQKTYAFTLTSTEWKFFSYNFSLTEAQLAHENKRKDFLLGALQKGDVQFCGVKLEQSDYVTAWAPSPFDSASITSVRTVTAKVSEIDQTVDGITTRVGSLETTIATKADSSTVETVSSNLSTLEQDVNGFKTTVASTYATKDELSTTDGNLSSLTSRVTTAESTITQHTTDIALKANSADVYTKTESDGLISTEVTNRNAAITAATEAIELSVSQTYTTKTEFSNLEIGGRNLLLDSYGSYNQGGYLVYGSVPTSVSLEEIGEGGTLTLQMWGIELDSDSTGISVYWGGGSITLFLRAKPDENGYICKTVTVTSAQAEHAHAKNKSINIYNFLNGHAGASLKIDRWKLERGTKPTDWTPAPEDMASQTDLTEAKAAIKVTTDGISTEVAKKVNGTEIISTINQSAELVKIQASKVDITGDVVFSAINTDTGTTKISGGKIDATSIIIGQSQVTNLTSDLAAKADTTDIPTNVSDLTNDSGYQTSTQVDTAITSKGYATTSQAQGYATTAQQNAEKTATNYIVADSSGIKIADADPSSATTYLHLASSFLDFIRDGASMLKAWLDGSVAKVRVGAESGFNTLTDNEGIKLRNLTAVLGQFTASAVEFYDGLGNAASNIVAWFGADGAQIGRTAESHIAMDYHSLQLVDKAGTNYFHVSDLRDRDGIAELTERFVATEDENQSFKLAYYPEDTDDISASTSDGDVTFTFDRINNTVVLDNALSDGTELFVSYTTTDNRTKAFTFGSRASGSRIGPMSFSAGHLAVASSPYSYAEGFGTTASGFNSHAEGSTSTASGNFSHAEGATSTASGNFSHTEGNRTTASGGSAHAEGNRTTASGTVSHSEGYSSTASGNYSHAEGYSSTASGNYSHAEGNRTTAGGSYSHAEGNQTTASGSYSHAEGDHTIASGNASHVVGRYNVDDTNSDYAFIVGNGHSSGRSNAFTVDWSGNVTCSGSITATNVPVTLYDNASASASATATLSETAANFKRMTIFFKDGDGTHGSVDVWSPNGKRVALSLTWISGNSTGDQTMYQRVRWVSISGTTISTFRNSTSERYRTGQAQIGGTGGVTNSDYIAITHVIGYR